MPKNQSCYNSSVRASTTFKYAKLLYHTHCTSESSINNNSVIFVLFNFVFIESRRYINLNKYFRAKKAFRIKRIIVYLIVHLVTFVRFCQRNTLYVM